MHKYLKFDELGHFWKYAFRESNAIIRSSRSRATDWSGSIGWNEAKLLAENGWNEGVLEIQKYSADYTKFVTERILRPFPQNTVCGYQVDIGAYLSNQPECFISRDFEEKKSPGNIYQIVCSITFSAAIKPETIIQRGAMICALIDAIEASGNRVEVVCNFAACKFHENRQGQFKSAGWFEVDVNLKNANQAADLSSLVFCLAHPAMLRRMMFSAGERVGWSDFVSNYGYPCAASNKGDIYIAEIFSGVVPDNKAIQWVVDQLLLLGIEIRDTTD